MRRENWEIMAVIIDTLITCARQRIALRGHRDHGRLGKEEPEENAGNFRGLLRMRIRSGDKVLEKHVKQGKGNSQYLK